LHTSLPVPEYLTFYGDGWGVSVLRPVGQASGFCEQSTTHDVVFRDFEIDGSLQGTSDGSYDHTAKGFYIVPMRNAIFQNLYVHDTSGTGIGVDNLKNCYFINCLVERCGRLNPGTGPGGAGIG